jgi:hypothetical protein
VAPDESRTVPVTEAESWAWRSIAEKIATTKTILLKRRMFIRDSLGTLEVGTSEGTSLRIPSLPALLTEGQKTFIKTCQ